MQDEGTVSVNMDVRRPIIWSELPEHHMELMRRVAYDVSNGKLPQRYRNHASTHIRWHPDETEEQMWAWYQGLLNRLGFATIYGFKPK